MVTLVTGASGFLGRHISEQLAGVGHTVIRAGRPECEIPSAAFERLIREHSLDLLVHAAGPSSVPESIEDPERDHNGSVGVLQQLLSLVETVEAPPAILFVSSAAVYGEPPTLPVAETAPLRPVSPYGRHRVECEALVRSAAASGLRAANLRVFSAYGEGLRRRLMWDICQQALTGAVTLFGTGDETRDFVHADDVARAVLTVAERAPLKGESYNVATGRETTVAEVAELLTAALRTDVRVAFSGETRIGDPSRWQGDISSIAALGYIPVVELEEGVTRYATWVDQELA